MGRISADNAENDSLGSAQEVGRRYTPGELPLKGEKRPS